MWNSKENNLQKDYHHLVHFEVHRLVDYTILIWPNDLEPILLCRGSVVGICSSILWKRLRVTKVGWKKEEHEHNQTDIMLWNPLSVILLLDFIGPGECNRFAPQKKKREKKWRFWYYGIVFYAFGTVYAIRWKLSRRKLSW